MALLSYLNKPSRLSTITETLLSTRQCLLLPPSLLYKSKLCLFPHLSFPSGSPYKLLLKDFGPQIFCWLEDNVSSACVSRAQFVAWHPSITLSYPHSPLKQHHSASPRSVHLFFVPELSSGSSSLWEFLKAFLNGEKTRTRKVSRNCLEPEL